MDKMEEEMEEDHVVEPSNVVVFLVVNNDADNKDPNKEDPKEDKIMNFHFPARSLKKLNEIICDHHKI